LNIVDGRRMQINCSLFYISSRDKPLYSVLKPGSFFTRPEDFRTRSLILILAGFLFIS
jgi:hypothetical protein